MKATKLKRRYPSQILNSILPTIPVGKGRMSTSIGDQVLLKWDIPYYHKGGMSVFDTAVGGGFRPYLPLMLPRKMAYNNLQSVVNFRTFYAEGHVGGLDEMYAIDNPSAEVVPDRINLAEEIQIQPGQPAVVLDFARFFSGEVTQAEFSAAVDLNFSKLADYQSSVFNVPEEYLSSIHDRICLSKIMYELAKTPLKAVYSLNSSYIEPLRCRDFRIPPAPYPQFINQTGESLYPLGLVADNHYGGTPVSMTYGFDTRDFYASMSVRQFSDTVTMAVAALKANGTPPFKIPAELGGGEKYLFITSPRNYQISSTEFGQFFDEVYTVWVPPEFLYLYRFGNHLFYSGYGYVLGYPGIFHFTPTPDYKLELTQQSTNYGRLVNIGFDEFSVYKSAMSPNGIAKYVVPAPNPMAVDDFYAQLPVLLGWAQDVVSVEPLVFDANLHVPAPQDNVTITVPDNIEPVEQPKEKEVEPPKEVRRRRKRKP